MNITKHHSIFPARNLGHFMDDLFNRSLADIVGNDYAISRPSVNIIETDDVFKVEMAAPGLQKSDFDIRIEGDKLVISAKKEVHNEETREKFTRREFNYSTFSRSFTVPDNVKTDHISAVYEHGVLSIDLPKNESLKADVARKIEIR